MKVAVVGATGMVGQMMLKVLEERNFPVTELIPVASERSIGKMVRYHGKDFPVVSMQEGIHKKPALALFSAGGTVLLDGSPDMTRNRRVAYNPPVDAVQEVKVEAFQPDAAYGNTTTEQLFEITAGESKSYHWKLSVPTSG